MIEPDIFFDAVFFIYKDYTLSPVSMNIAGIKQQGTNPLLTVQSLPFCPVPKKHSLSALSQVTLPPVPLPLEIVPLVKALTLEFAIRALGNPFP